MPPVNMDGGTDKQRCRPRKAPTQHLSEEQGRKMLLRCLLRHPLRITDTYTAHRTMQTRTCKSLPLDIPLLTLTRRRFRRSWLVRSYERRKPPFQATPRQLRCTCDEPKLRSHPFRAHCSRRLKPRSLRLDLEALLVCISPSAQRRRCSRSRFAPMRRSVPRFSRIVPDTPSPLMEME